MLSKTSLISALVVQGALVVIGLLSAFGLPLTSEQVGAISSAAGFLGGTLTLVIWAMTVPREQVVERLIGEAVVAGEANDVVPNGQAVRNLGDEPRRAAETERTVDLTPPVEDWRVEDDQRPN